jgi:hypothetical protein
MRLRLLTVVVAAAVMPAAAGAAVASRWARDPDRTAWTRLHPPPTPAPALLRRMANLPLIRGSLRTTLPCLTEGRRG